MLQMFGLSFRCGLVNQIRLRRSVLVKEFLMHENFAEDIILYYTKLTEEIGFGLKIPERMYWF